MPRFVWSPFSPRILGPSLLSACHATLTSPKSSLAALLPVRTPTSLIGPSPRLICKRVEGFRAVTRALLTLSAVPKRTFASLCPKLSTWKWRTMLIMRLIRSSASLRASFLVLLPTLTCSSILLDTIPTFSSTLISTRIALLPSSTKNKATPLPLYRMLARETMRCMRALTNVKKPYITSTWTLPLKRKPITVPTLS